MSYAGALSEAMSMTALGASGKPSVLLEEDIAASSEDEAMTDGREAEVVSVVSIACARIEAGVSNAIERNIVEEILRSCELIEPSVLPATARAAENPVFCRCWVLVERTRISRLWLYLLASRSADSAFTSLALRLD